MGKNYNNDGATQKLKAVFGDSARLPSDVEFVLENSERDCRIKLDHKKVQEKNMQIDANAFEAWAVALYIALNESGKIILDVDEKFEPMEYEGNGHWGRFLYRALRFSEQYEWFELADKVEVHVKKFEAYLNNESNIFTNNLPKGEAGVKEKHNNENVVEAKFADDAECRKKFDFFCDNPVYRQLPVGLFRIAGASKKGEMYKCSKDTMVFTGGKSAIDLWTWNENKFEVIELKTRNKMAGIITEIFFYSNYMYDFLVRDTRRFRLNKYNDSNESNDRGYKKIFEKGFNEIQGIMLADEYHLILNNERVLEVLNNNNLAGNIKYMKAEYKYGITIDCK